MLLHDWSALPGWDGVHQVWIVELLYCIKLRLPVGTELTSVQRPHSRSVPREATAGRGSSRLTSPCSPPIAVAYRVGELAPGGGRFLALWRRHLAVGSPLPAMRLPLSVQESVPVDLEATYHRATEAVYLNE